MNTHSKTLKVILCAGVGAVVGFLIPWGVALMNVIPRFNGETPYEAVLEWMVVSAGTGALLGACLGVYRYK